MVWKDRKYKNLVLLEASKLEYDHIFKPRSRGPNQGRIQEFVRGVIFPGGGVKIPSPLKTSLDQIYIKYKSGWEYSPTQFKAE